jgi:hypothetical protein
MTTLRGDISVLQCGLMLQGLQLPWTLLLWTNTAALKYLKTLLTILATLWCIRGNLHFISLQTPLVYMHLVHTADNWVHFIAMQTNDNSQR